MCNYMKLISVYHYISATSMHLMACTRCIGMKVWRICLGELAWPVLEPSLSQWVRSVWVMSRSHQGHVKVVSRPYEGVKNLLGGASVASSRAVLVTVGQVSMGHVKVTSRTCQGSIKDIWRCEESVWRSQYGQFSSCPCHSGSGQY